MNSFVEKRKQTRIPIEDVTVEIYSPHGAPDSPEICSILDLSESGMRFECSNLYETSQYLRLTFMLPDSIAIIRTNATVIHNYKGKSVARVGVRFEKLNVVERNCIRQFVQHRPNNRKDAA